MPSSSTRHNRNKVGRPPAGDGGARVKDYPQVSFRLPKDARDKLVALGKVRKQPQWRVIVDSVECYLRHLSRSEQTLISRMMSNKGSRS
jgi:hypothetical protein